MTNKDDTCDVTFTLSDSYTIDIDPAANITTHTPVSSWSTDSITIGSNPASTFTVSDDVTLKFDNDITFTTHEPVDFIDCLPSFQKIQDMCSEYPGLDKAFDNFKMTYKMVHQDWVGKQKKND